MSAPKLTLYFDVLSPFAYMAFYRVVHSSLRAHTTFVPVFLGGILKDTSNKAPLTIPLKGRYIFHDLRRQAKATGIPLLPSGRPDTFPISTLLAMRVLCVVQKHFPSELVKCAGGLYEALWVHGRGVDKQELVSEIVGGVVGKEGWEKIMSLVGSEGKQVLLENSGEAMKKGAFGLPWHVATNADGKEDVWWGFDKLPVVAEYMGVPLVDENPVSKL